MITGMMLRFDSLELLQRLNDEQYGRLIRAALVFAKSRAEAEAGEQREPELSAPECYLWPGLRMAIIQDQENYKAKCEQNRKNIEGYWAGQRQQEQPEAEDTTVYDRIRPDTNININHNPNININHNINHQDQSQSQGRDRLRADGYTDQEIDRAISRASGKRVRNMEAYIRKSISNERQQQKRVPAQDYSQRDYTGVQEEIEERNRAEVEEKLKRKYGKTVIAQQYEQRDYSGVQAELEAQQDKDMEEFMRQEKEGGQP